MFQRVGPMAFKKDLGNIRELLKVLDHPHQKFKSIHIAGTNGKGSLTHMLAAVFMAAGYKVGMYTSPHYKDFRERIKINGQLIQKKAVVDFVDNYHPDFESIKPSFFEWTVALAFDYFANEKVDIAIVETGLGGRLDSTNVLHPLLSIITNIGFDHTEMLGDTLPEIAFEKAGIIKNNTPVVIGESNPGTGIVFNRKATELNAPITYADKEFKVEVVSIVNGNSILKVTKNDKILFEKLAIQHAGKFQEKNVATLLCSLNVFENRYPEWFPDLDNSIPQGLKKLKDLTYFIGRWEFISASPKVLVDSAHNEDGIRQLTESLKQMDFDKLYFVLGLVADKNHDKVLSLLPKNATYYFAKANIPRGFPAAELEKKATRFGLNGKSYTSVRRALSAAKTKCKENDLIFVGGSIFVVAEVI